jgi:hypothetical protein
MHVTLTRVNTAGQPQGNATIVAEEMHRWLRDIDGFVGLLLMSDEETTVGLTFWETSEIAERHRVARREFLERMMSVAGVEIEEVIDYQVSFAQLGPALMNFAA